MAIGSTLFGCISEVMLDSTAVVTLYFFALDGSAAMTVFAAGLTFDIFRQIPVFIKIERFVAFRTIQDQ